MEEQAGADVPVQHKSAFLAFLQQLSSFNGDLSALTCPTFMLNGLSLLQYSLHWCDYPALFAAIAHADDPIERMVCVVRWFVATLYGSFHERCVAGSEKKPFNPVLGEQFFCAWKQRPDDALPPWGDMSMTVEQVSHHPPISAFYLRAEKSQLELYGHCGQQSKFKAIGMTIKVEQTGHTTIINHKHKESYDVSLPELVLRGILSGKIFVELTGKTRITSSSNVVAEIEFLPKPWFSGDYHHIKGHIALQNMETAPLFTLSGQWTGVSYIQASKKHASTASVASSGSTVSIAPIVLHDATQRPKDKKIIKDISEQGELESQRVWHPVVVALQANNYGQASKEKNAIEERQRALRKERAAKGDLWRPKYFSWVGSESDVRKASTSKEDGEWRFNEML